MGAQLLPRDHGPGVSEEQRERAGGLRLDPDEPPLLAQLAGNRIELEQAEAEHPALLLDDQ
jgi:hypothetical protein